MTDDERRWGEDDEREPGDRMSRGVTCKAASEEVTWKLRSCRMPCVLWGTPGAVFLFWHNKLYMFKEYNLIIFDICVIPEIITKIKVTQLSLPKASLCP